MKFCRKCQTTKSLSLFGIDRRREDGTALNCKECTARLCRERNRGNEKVLARYRKRNADEEYKALRKEIQQRPEVKLRNAEQQRRWRSVNKHKRHAHSVVAWAIKKGRLLKQPCEVCGGDAEAHHDDYSKPLEVRWLCPLHHAREHSPYAV